MGVIDLSKINEALAVEFLTSASGQNGIILGSGSSRRCHPGTPEVLSCRQEFVCSFSMPGQLCLLLLCTLLIALSAQTRSSKGRGNRGEGIKHVVFCLVLFLSHFYLLSLVFSIPLLSLLSICLSLTPFPLFLFTFIL